MESQPRLQAYAHTSALDLSYTVDKSTQANEHDNVLLYRQQTEKCGKKIKELTDEVDTLRKELAEHRYKKEGELTGMLQKVIDLEAQNSILVEENNALNEEYRKIEVQTRRLTTLGTSKTGPRNYQSAPTRSRIKRTRTRTNKNDCK